MLDQYNLFIQQQVQQTKDSINQSFQLASNAAQSTVLSKVDALAAIKSFNELLASQEKAYMYNSKLDEINYGSALQNAWSLRKMSDVNNNIIFRQGSAAKGEIKAQAAASDVVANTGTSDVLQNQMILETSRASSNQYREDLTKIDQALDQSLQLALKKNIADWTYEQQKEFLTKSFAGSIPFNRDLTEDQRQQLKENGYVLW